MVQDGKSQEIEETDGLPFPQRIWAVVAIGFALCMSVLDINISTVILPTLAHDFGTSDSVITWIAVSYTHLTLPTNWLLKCHYFLFLHWAKSSDIVRYSSPVLLYFV